MKRIATLGAIALLVAVPMTSEAAPKRKERTETLSYTLPTGVTAAGAASTASCGDPVRKCLVISLGKDEKYIKFVAKDSAGQSVGIQYYPGTTSADYSAGVQYTCGEGKATFKKPTEVSFRIAIDSSCPGVPTSGTLTVVISNLP